MGRPTSTGVVGVGRAGERKAASAVRVGVGRKEPPEGDVAGLGAIGRAGLSGIGFDDRSDDAGPPAWTGLGWIGLVGCFFLAITAENLSILGQFCGHLIAGRTEQPVTFHFCKVH